MISESLLVASILVMVLLGLASTGTVMAHATVSAARNRRFVRPMDEARQILVAALCSSTAPSADELESVRSLPRDRLITLVSELAQSFRGEGDALIGSLASDLGIVDRGLTRIESRLWWRRLEGARLLTLFDEARHVRPRLLQDRHPLVRAQACEWAAGDATGAEIHALVALLGDRDGLTRYSAKDALIRLGTDAAAVLAEELNAAAAEDAVALLEVVAAINDSRLLPGALRLAAEPDPRIRALAAQLLGTVGGVDALDCMTDLLVDPDETVRAAAAEGLGRLGYWPVSSQLADRLEDPSWNVRYAAGLALRSIGAPGLLLLRRATKSSDVFAADMARQVLDLRELDEVVQ